MKHVKLNDKTVLIAMAILIFGFYIYNYFKILETAYRCYDENKKQYLLFISKEHSRIAGKTSNWIKEEISNYEEDMWQLFNYDTNKGKIISKYKRPYSSNEKYKFYEFISDKKEKFSLRISDYRIEVFDKKNEVFSIYEYENFRSLTESYLLSNTEDDGFKIKINLKKFFKCAEDKKLYKEWLKNIKNL